MRRLVDFVAAAELKPTNENLELTQEIEPIPAPMGEPLPVDTSAEPEGESAIDPNEPVFPVDDPVAIIEDEAEQEVAEKELDVVGEEIDAAGCAIERLEEMKDLTEEAIKEDGGLTETEAEVIEITHESIMAALDMSHRRTKKSASPVVTMEHYSNPRTKLTASMVTMEKLGDSVELVKGKVKEGLRKFAQMVKDMLKRLLRNYDGYHRKATEVLKAAQALPSNAVPVESVLTSEDATAAGIGGTVNKNTARTLILETDKIGSSLGTMIRTIKPKLTQSDHDVEGVLDALEAFKSSAHGINIAPGYQIQVVDGGLDHTEVKRATSAPALTRDDIISLMNELNRSTRDNSKVINEFYAFMDGFESLDHYTPKDIAELRSEIQSVVSVATKLIQLNTSSVYHYANVSLRNLKAPEGK